MFNTEGKKRVYKAVKVALAITLFVAVLIVAPVAILVSMMFIVVDEIYLFVHKGRATNCSKAPFDCMNAKKQNFDSQTEL